MKHALLALTFAAFSFAAIASNSPSTSKEVAVTTQIDHVVVYQQGAQIERVAEVDLASGLSTVVFQGLNTAIDPAKISLTGNGPFQVLSITHRYHTDTLSGAGTAEERNRLQIERNELQKQINQLNTQNVIFDREEQLLLNNQGFTVKYSGVDLERLSVPRSSFASASRPFKPAGSTSKSASRISKNPCTLSTGNRMRCRN